MNLPCATNSAVHVRAACLDDAPAVAAVKRAAATRVYAPCFGATALQSWLERRATSEFVAGRISVQGPDSSSAFLVGTRGDVVVGAGLIRREPAGAYLADVYCDPPGSGAGRVIVNRLLDHARTHRWGPVRCFVIADNKDAVVFFTSLGFTAHALTPNVELPGALLEMRRPGRSSGA